MSRAAARRALVLAVVLVACMAMVPVAGVGEQVPLAIATVSSRADVVSDGDTLIEVDAPGGAGVEGLEFSADRPGVTIEWGEVDGRVLGLVAGLPLGPTTLQVRRDDAAGTELEVTNHPAEGPIFSGRQITPWICSTEYAGLGWSEPDVCHVVDTVKRNYRWYFRSVVNYSFVEFDPAQMPPMSDVATTTTDDGHTVPFIVRVERGTMNRGIYDFAILDDPREPDWSVFTPQDGWNGKVFWRIGTSTGVSHRQGVPNAVMMFPVHGSDLPVAGHDRPVIHSSTVPMAGYDGPVLDSEALSRGHAVVVSTTVNNGKMYKPLVAAETISMVNERIAERYGPIRHVIPEGYSGGAVVQIAVASAYPGLLDGIKPGASYLPYTPVTEAADCVVLRRYFDEVGLVAFASPADQAKVMGHGTRGTCDGLVGIAADAVFDPSKGCLDPNDQDPAWAYDPLTGEGVRCTLADAHAGPWPVDPETGIVNPPWDNVGVQYGLEALLDDRLTAEQFVHLNANVGGFDADYEPTAERMAGDVDTIRAMYMGGFLADGRNLTGLPVLDYRGHNFQVEFHPGIMSVKLRELVDGAGGGHVAMWIDERPYVLGGGTQESPQGARSWDTMDAWLSEIDRLEVERPGADRDTILAAARPEIAVDSCWVADQQLRHAEQCGDLYPTAPDTRMLAGSPLNWPLKCGLKPLARADYPGVVFSDAQWDALLTAFPTGVCDWTQPGQGVEAPVAEGWITFADGDPGGRPMGPAPTSRPITE